MKDNRHLEAKWTIGVDWRGDVFIINEPDIQESFLQFGCADETGITPCWFPDYPAGVYEIETHYREHVDFETGIVDDYRFVITSMKMIFPEPTDDGVQQ